MAAINILTDLFVLVLPIHPAVNLNINRRKKCKWFASTCPEMIR
jgi:hypothetical protein